MLDKINISKIVENHFNTLRNANTKKAELDDYITFLFIPIIATGLLIWKKTFLDTNSINIIITTLSILVGLFFNVIVLIFDIIKRDKNNNIKNVVLKELQANIAYIILISIISILICLVTYIDNCIIKYISNSVVFFLLTNLIMTVLMVLKRMFHLFDKEFEDETK